MGERANHWGGGSHEMLNVEERKKGPEWILQGKHSYLIVFILHNHLMMS